MPEDDKKTIIGLAEKVIVYDQDRKNAKEIIARIDTGATSSAIDARLAAEIKPGPIVKTTLVRSTHGSTLRPVIEVNIDLAGKVMKATFTVADRTKMKYRMLIGQNILKENGFLIDPNK